MLSMAIITFREGVEAFLIVAITLAYLRRSGREALVPAAIAGIVASVAASAAGAWLFSRTANQPLWEGILALVAAVLVASMVLYMMRTARYLRANIHAGIDRAAARPGTGAKLAVFAFVVLMISREGMETALLVSSLAQQVGSGATIAGAAVGILAAALLAWAWTIYGHRINLARFFQVTSVFLLLFAGQLVVLAFHEFTEANVLPVDNAFWHVATEPFSPEGEYGSWITLSLIALPLGWLAVSALRNASLGSGAAAAAPKD
ncbi:MAG: iron permease FTR1 [Rhodocyclales bacterium CG_4_10_14_3_um_filter_68_10]|nr:MAG: iron permease FTR1 [Rhodocyclales bacterium CG_4_10_14_3_um_filter_68_10]